MITVFANLKGGSGKSTVAFNLGIWLARHGVPVVAYDLDPQRSLEDAARVRAEEGFAPPLEVYPPEENLEAGLTYHRGEVLVDVGASSMEAMRAALSVSGQVVIPVPPGQADVWATQRFLAMLREVEYKGDPPRVRAFVNRADTHHWVRESDETEEALASLDGLEVIPQRLAQRTAFRRSFSEGMGVSEFLKNSKAAVELDALAGALYPSVAE